MSNSRLTKLGVVLLVDAGLLVLVWLILLLAMGGTAAQLVHLLPVAAAGFVAAAFWKRRPKSRIKFLPANQTVFIAEADKRLCYACKQELMPDQATTRCSVTRAHAVHAACASFVRGKCPQCGNALESRSLQSAG